MKATEQCLTVMLFFYAVQGVYKFDSVNVSLKCDH